MKKIRKNDKVLVIAGKARGKTGVVLSVLGQFAMVDNIGGAKKHMRPNPSQGTQGGIIEKNMPIHISNLAIVDETGKASRVFIKNEDGKKVRVLKTTNMPLSD